MCRDGTWLDLSWLGAKGDVLAAQQPLAAVFCSHSDAVVLLWGTSKLSLAYFTSLFFSGLVLCSRYGLLILSLLTLLCCTLNISICLIFFCCFLFSVINIQISCVSPLNICMLLPV